MSEQSLSCLAEASPKPINYWTFGTGEMIVANEKFIVNVSILQKAVQLEVTLWLKILQVYFKGNSKLG